MIGVTVIVAAYRAMSTLERTLTSVLAQTYADWEVIVVDDASPDGTAALVERFTVADARIRLLRMPRNGGPGAARNMGLDAARGRWIAMLDADDAFAPDRLARLIAAAETESLHMVADDLIMESAGEPSRLMLGARIPPEGLILDPLGFVAGNRGARGQGRVLYGFLKPLIAREFLVAHGLHYHQLRLAEDYFLYLEALLAGARWRVIPYSGYRYTLRTDSLTASFTPAELDAMANTDKLILDSLDARRRPAETAAIRRHRTDVLAAATWTRLVSALRRRDGATFVQALRAPPGAWPGTFGKAAAAAPRALSRILRSREV